MRRLKSNEGKHVLVAEDSDTMRNYFVTLLKLQNFEVIEAVDGQDALEKLAETPVDCVITDYDMPRIDGLGLLRKVRKQYSSLALSVIGISSTENTLVPTRFLKVGANDYLAKPFSQSELICRLSNIFEWLETTRRIETLAITDQLIQLKNRNYFYQVVPLSLCPIPTLKAQPRRLK